MSTEASDPVRETVTEFANKQSLLVLFLITGVFLFPMLLIVLTSFKSRSEIFSNLVSLPETIRVENYAGVWTTGGFEHYFTNSVIGIRVNGVDSTTVQLGGLHTGTVGLPDRRPDVCLLPGRVYDPDAGVTRLAVHGHEPAGLLNTYFSLIFAYMAFGLPFLILLLRQFFVTIPDTYAETARMDGCTEFQVFLYAIIFITDDGLRPLSPGLMTFQGQYMDDWAQLFAGIVIIVAPPVLFFQQSQQQFIRDVSMGTTKG